MKLLACGQLQARYIDSNKNPFENNILCVKQYNYTSNIYFGNGKWFFPVDNYLFQLGAGVSSTA